MQSLGVPSLSLCLDIHTTVAMTRIHPLPNLFWVVGLRKGEGRNNRFPGHGVVPSSTSSSASSTSIVQVKYSIV